MLSLGTLKILVSYQRLEELPTQKWVEMPSSDDSLPVA
jgi:hypothetical protein